MSTVRSWFKGRKVAAVALATGLLVSGSVGSAHAADSYYVMLKESTGMQYHSAVVHWQYGTRPNDESVSGCVRVNDYEYAHTGFRVDADAQVKVWGYYDDSCGNLGSKHGPYKAPGANDTTVDNQWWLTF